MELTLRNNNVRNYVFVRRGKYRDIETNRSNTLKPKQCYHDPCASRLKDPDTYKFFENHILHFDKVQFPANFIAIPE